MSSGSVLLFGKDIYVLELAADVNLMGAFGTALAIWGPVTNPFSGYCLEKNILGKIFPWEKWGRRAPWYLTHLIGAATCSCLMWLPPSFDPTLLSFWFLAMGSGLCWTLAVVFASFQSARVEIYPLKEERSEVEAYSKIMAGAGSGLGTAPQLIIAAVATRLVMTLSSVFLLALGLVSLISVPVFCEARVPHDPGKISSFFAEFWSLSKNGTMRHLLAYRFIEGLYTTVVLTSSLYYLTFIDGLWGSTRSTYVVVLGVVLAAVTIIMIPCWTQFYRVKRPGVNVNTVSSISLGSSLLAPLVLLLLRLTPLPTPVPFIFYCTVLQIFITGQTFWRFVVLAWVIDEDAHAVDGRRREALFAGAVAFADSIGRACASGLVLNGMALAGMHLESCQTVCDDDDNDCLEECQQANAEGQPGSVKTYIDILFFLVVPVCQVVATLLVYTFPIYGERVERIYAKQKVLYSGNNNLHENGSVVHGEDGTPQDGPK